MADLWARYRKYCCEAAGFVVDISRMRFPDDFFGKMARAVERAFADMEALERGAIANPDEQRMVGHYWLRNPALAPDPTLRRAIEAAQQQVREFAAQVHDGRIAPQRGGRFRRLLVIGIGGSALGPQCVAHALGTADDRMKPCFLDNTDPDGMDRVLSALGNGLAATLTMVISKSGTTPETANGMAETRARYEQAGLAFARHAVAVTGETGKLHDVAAAEGWLGVFPMWDWVGGRTSVTSAVGLLPASLQGLDVEALLRGAREMDAATRQREALRNPAALLALMWYYAGEGRGSKAMVVLPYKDRLELFSHYLQQLVMESLGKELDLDGRLVNQGLTVYGNKGSTDQHAYVQQLREGLNDFFVTFIEVLKGRDGRSSPVGEIELGEGARVPVTSGDYLSGFLLGTRRALSENHRESITLTIPEVNAENVGKLIALFERAVGLYASLVHINAYHQPGVEAGKKAAAAVLRLQAKAVHHLGKCRGQRFSLEDLARAIGEEGEIEALHLILRRLTANGVVHHAAGATPFDGDYWL